MTFFHFFSILRARWRLGLSVVLGVLALVVALSLVLPKKYTATATVVVDVKPDPITGMVLAGATNPALMATQVDILTSDRVTRRVVRSLKLDQNADIRQAWEEDTEREVPIEDWLVDLLQRRLDVKPSRESNVIAVSYKASDSDFAVAMANAFVKAYLDTTLELRVDPARQYSGFFESQSKEARVALEKAQSKLSEFQRTNGIVGNDERLDVETTRLNDLSTQLVVSQAAAADSSSRQAQAANGNADRMTEALSNPVISSMKVDLSRAEASLQEMNARLGANHPQVVQTRANIVELRSKLDSEIKRVTGGVGVAANISNARVGELRAQLEVQRAKVLKLKETRDAMATLQREVDNSQRAYDAIMTRLNQTALESQTQQSNVNILSMATPPLQPSFPKWPLNILAAIVLGVLLAIATVLVREKVDPRVRSSQDLVNGLGLPILGVMPRPVVVKRRPSLMAQRVIFGRLSGPAKK